MPKIETGVYGYLSALLKLVKKILQLILKGSDFRLKSYQMRTMGLHIDRGRFNITAPLPPLSPFVSDLVLKKKYFISEKMLKLVVSR